MKSHKTKICCFCACFQASFWRPTRAVNVTPSQAVKPVTYFRRRRTDAVSLTLQSAVKHYYPPVMLLIPRKHPVVTGNVVQALDRTWYRMWYHTAVSASVTGDIAVNISSLWLVSSEFYFIYSFIFLCLSLLSVSANNVHFFQTCHSCCRFLVFF